METDIYNDEKRKMYYELYPVTIVSDRYGGTYSGGNYLAFKLYFYELPEDIDGSDPCCWKFWDNYEGVVGKGDTPDEALYDLWEKVKYDKQKKEDGDE